MKPSGPWLNKSISKYNIIYADPPWNFQTYSEKGQGKTPHRHYKCLRLEDLKKLPIDKLAAKNCVLLLWVIDTHLEVALELMAAWGFKYKTIAFVWAKTTTHGKWHFGQGFWTRKNPEICLLGSRGHPKKNSWSVRQLVVEPVRQHSRKPDRIRSDIVQLLGNVPRVELFARNRTPGWDVWGNEIQKFRTSKK